MPDSHVPSGYHAVTPYLLAPRVGEVLEFVEKTFGATCTLRLARPDGTVMHTGVRIDGSTVMLGEPNDEFGRMPGQVFVYVPDCDAAHACALEHGGTNVMDPTLMEHAGRRYGGVRDLGGNAWWIANRVEDVPPEEQQRRIDAILGKDRS